MNEAKRVNPLRRLHALGQSPWLDFIDRDLVRSGELKRLVDRDGIRGVTTNPAIFERAITSSDAYDAAIRASAKTQRAEEIYEALALADVVAAADVLRPLYAESGGHDGFVSLEVSPHLANHTDATVKAARRLWRALDRPNAMIKVPATQAGLPAIRALIGAGIHVNVTLLFDLDRYRQVIGAYVDGLRDRAVGGKPLEDVSCVASFFLSRIDALVDRELLQVVAQGGDRAQKALQLKGRVAIACARCAYAIFQECFEAPGCTFATLRVKGARPQRLLWASTSPKDPTYPDTKYVDALIGPETVTTLPMATLRAYADHGDPAPRLAEGRRTGDEVLAAAREVGLDLSAVAEQLLEEGLRKFDEPYDALLAAIQRKRSGDVAQQEA
jgi:transaldolase